MNTIRDLKQQEKYDNMLKRKNKEKNIYKSKNSTLRIEKMNLIKAIERKDKEIERLKKAEKEALDTLESATYENINLTNEVDRLNNIINETSEILKFHLSNPSQTINGWHIDIWNSEDIEKLNKMLNIIEIKEEK